MENADDPLPGGKYKENKIRNDGKYIYKKIKSGPRKKSTSKLSSQPSTSSAINHLEPGPITSGSSDSDIIVIETNIGAVSSSDRVTQVYNDLSSWEESNTRKARKDAKLLHFRDKLEKICTMKIATGESSDDEFDIMSNITAMSSSNEALADNPEKGSIISYKQKIFKAIQSSPEKMLPLAKIYEYVKREYPDRKKYNNDQWKNAIRHNLSVQDCFEKIPIEFTNSSNWRIKRTTRSSDSDDSKAPFETLRKYSMYDKKITVYQNNFAEGKHDKDGSGDTYGSNTNGTSFSSSSSSRSSVVVLKLAAPETTLKSQSQDDGGKILTNTEKVDSQNISDGSKNTTKRKRGRPKKRGRPR